MTSSGRDPQDDDAHDVSGPENDSGRRPDHEAVGVGVIHGAQGEPPSSGAEAAAGAAPGGPASRADALDDDQGRRLPTIARDDDATIETVSGIVAQTRQDSGTEPLERIGELLRERLQRAGVELANADIDELARQVSTGDSADADADADAGPD